MRVCRVCGCSLEGHRRQAAYCGPPCRREACRLRAILAGRNTAEYPSLAHRERARRKRAGRLSGLLPDEEAKR